MTQLSLLADVVRVQRPKPMRHVSPVSAINWRALVDSQTLPRRRQAVLEAIAEFRTERGYFATTSELCRFMVSRGTLARESSNLISGRLTELTQSGICEFLKERPCRISGKPAQPIRIVYTGEETSERKAFLA